MKSVDKANNPRRLAAGDEVQVGAKKTLLHLGDNSDEEASSQRDVYS